ncbi:MAG: hypothetical protein FWC75_02110 [Oscillospiraceae bacterium]|nr:hypothetical protein [Oscillospiraceae bacterium]
MRSKSGVLPISLIGIIMVALTLVAFFLLDIERIAVHIWALAFLLLSEVVLFGGLIGLRFAGASHSSVFLRAGVSTSLVLYFVATLISALFAGFFRDRINSFILIELAIIAFFAIITISILAWSRSIARRNEADMAKIGTNEPKRGGF